jgi:predicted DNA-binding transcriptional regulator AlpA
MFSGLFAFTFSPQPLNITIYDLQNLIRMGRTATYRLTTSPSFPKPYAITGKALRWDQKEILDWLDGQSPGRELLIERVVNYEIRKNG